MSFEAWTGALKILRTMPHIKATRRLLLLMLADRHNAETGRCDPSLAVLMADTSMDRHTVVDGIKALEEAGLLSVDRAFGQRSSFGFPWLSGVDFPTGTGVEKHTGSKNTSVEKHTGGSVDFPTGTGVEKHTTTSVENHTHLNQELNQEVNQEVKPLSPKPSLSPSPALAKAAERQRQEKSWFAAWWEAYPSPKQRHRECWILWQEHGLESIGQLIAEDTRARRRDDAQWQEGFHPSPFKYLEGHRWEDEISNKRKNNNDDQFSEESINAILGL